MVADNDTEQRKLCLNQMNMMCLLSNVYAQAILMFHRNFVMLLSVLMYPNDPVFSV